MKIAYFDTISGISGDMILGALIDAGIDIAELNNEIRKLNFKGVELVVERIEQNGISAVKLNVIISTQEQKPRHLDDVLKIIDASELDEEIKKTSKKIFFEIAESESKVHRIPIEKVHFHEVGAVDSIVDIVGATICLDKLGIKKVFSSPIKIGCGGFVEADHGKLPVPSPAVVEILKSYPVMLTDIPFELTTPTGAAIIKALSSGILSSEKIEIESIGYSAGTKEIPQVPNLLRVMIGELPNQFISDEVLIVETNIDDMNPEIYPYVIEQLLSSGAHDAYLIPIIMKKGRPGILLSVLASRSEVEKILKIIYRETTTLGVRIIETSRKKIEREIQKVQSKHFGNVLMKVINYEGEKCYVPEFEECKRISVERKLSIRDVYKILEHEFCSYRR